MAFSEKQQEFFNNCNHRWNIKVGATRSGKTYGDYYWIPKRIRNRVNKEGASVILGVSKSTIERNILEPMRNKWGQDLVRTISTDNTCYLFGERVHCLGAEKISQVSKIRGMSIKYCYGDEIAEWNKEVFELLKSRLDKEYSCFDGALNPEGPNHWLKKFLDSDADIYIQHYTIFDNPFLPSEFVEQLCKEYEGTVYYDRYILGNWAFAEGLIFPMYEDAIADAVNAGTPEEYCLSIDYGTMNAFAAVLWGKYGSTWYGLRELYYSGRDTGIQKTDSEYAEMLDDFIGTLEDLETIIDPSAASFITLLRKNSNKYRVRKANNDVKNGIEETARALKSGRIKISKNMKNWKNEAGGYIWKPDSPEDEPVKVNDHLMDATRYFVKTKRIANIDEELEKYVSPFSRRK